MNFKISIVIATFNSDRTLKQTLDSIRYQTYKNIELIVVDGLSSDNTLDIIKEYTDIVSKYISEKDNGIYEAFNKGINLATGDYIGFIGSDDCYIDYSVFDNIIKDLSVDVDMISYPIVCIDEYYKNEYIFINNIDKEDILTGKMLPHPGLFVKTEIMKKYMFNEKNKIISDYEFLLRYLIDGGVVNFRDYPVAYFSNSGVSSSNFNSESWKCEISEHLTLYKNIELEQKYLFGYLNQVFKYEERENSKYLIILLMKNLLKKFKLAEIVKILLGIKKKHKCNLKYCRWCGRYGE
ncbi:MAG: glycosyltransferase family 2 protein [Acidaminococcaceae bacterium]|nr:glycosyltransferase family 2 protein [Acidaminococcaceae bacterium]